MLKQAGKRNASISLQLWLVRLEILSSVNEFVLMTGTSNRKIGIYH